MKLLQVFVFVCTVLCGQELHQVQATASHTVCAGVNITVAANVRATAEEGYTYDDARQACQKLAGGRLVSSFLFKEPGTDQDCLVLFLQQQLEEASYEYPEAQIWLDACPTPTACELLPIRKGDNEISPAAVPAAVCQVAPRQTVCAGLTIALAPAVQLQFDLSYSHNAAAQTCQAMAGGSLPSSSVFYSAGSAQTCLTDFFRTAVTTYDVVGAGLWLNSCNVAGCHVLYVGNEGGIVVPNDGFSTSTWGKPFIVCQSPAPQTICAGKTITVAPYLSKAGWDGYSFDEADRACKTLPGGRLVSESIATVQASQCVTSFVTTVVQRLYRSSAGLASIWLGDCDHDDCKMRLPFGAEPSDTAFSNIVAVCQLSPPETVCAGKRIVFATPLRLDTSNGYSFNDSKLACQSLPGGSLLSSAVYSQNSSCLTGFFATAFSKWTGYNGPYANMWLDSCSRGECDVAVVWLPGRGNPSRTAASATQTFATPAAVCQIAVCGPLPANLTVLPAKAFYSAGDSVIVKCSLGTRFRSLTCQRSASSGRPQWSGVIPQCRSCGKDVLGGQINITNGVPVLNCQAASGVMPYVKVPPYGTPVCDHDLGIYNQSCQLLYRVDNLKAFIAVGDVARSGNLLADAMVSAEMCHSFGLPVANCDPQLNCFSPCQFYANNIPSLPDFSYFRSTSSIVKCDFFGGKVQPFNASSSATPLKAVCFRGCPSLPHPITLTPSKPAYSVGDVVTANCSDGRPAVQLTCEARKLFMTAAWTGEIPLCNALCPAKPKLAHAMPPSRFAQQVNTVGTRRAYTCQPNYQLAFDKELVCQVNPVSGVAQWTGNVKCTVRCDAPLPPLVVLVSGTASGSVYSVGDQIEVKCAGGSRSSHLTCQQGPDGNKYWGGGDIPVCTACPTKSVLGGLVSTQNGSAVITCNRAQNFTKVPPHGAPVCNSDFGVYSQTCQKHVRITLGRSGSVVAYTPVADLPLSGDYAVDRTRSTQICALYGMVIPRNCYRYCQPLCGAFSPTWGNWGFYARLPAIIRCQSSASFTYYQYIRWNYGTVGYSNGNLRVLCEGCSHIITNGYLSNVGLLPLSYASAYDTQTLPSSTGVATLNCDAGYRLLQPASHVVCNVTTRFWNNTCVLDGGYAG